MSTVMRTDGTRTQYAHAGTEISPEVTSIAQRMSRNSTGQSVNGGADTGVVG